ncbi:MAG: proton-conducting transporter membrane subunit [Eubacteriales bacterium]|nr:proton-conducting transporter membrane subunit [Eubacteriales bacterium]
MSVYLLVLWPIFGAIALYWILGLKSMENRGDFVFGTFAVICTAAEVLLVAFLMTENITVAVSRFGWFGLEFRFGSLSALLCLVAAFAWFVTLMFSRTKLAAINHAKRFYCCYLLALSSVIGIFLAADFYTLLLFAVMLSLSSFGLTANDEKPHSLKSARTALVFSVAGGALLAAGMTVLHRQIGSLSFNTVYTFSGYTDSRILFRAALLMLTGFGMMACMFPLHIWMPGVTTSVSAAAGALISGVITGCGLYGIITITVDMMKGNEAWTSILLVTGCVTMMWGALCAFFSTDLRRIFSYTAMSQSGVILIGTGLFSINSSVYASSGLILHMLNTPLIMLVLFGCAGVIGENVGSYELNDMIGFGHGKPFLNAALLSGMLGVGGIPLWNGYISRGLLHESMLSDGSTLLEFVFLLAGGIVIACMARIYISLFIYKRTPFTEPAGEYIDAPSRVALIITAAILPVIGILPNHTARGIVDFSIKKLRAGYLEPLYYFSGDMLIRAFIALVIGALLYALFMRKPSREPKKSRLAEILPAIYAGAWEISDRINTAEPVRGKKAEPAEPGASPQTALRRYSSALLAVIICLCAVMTVLVIKAWIQAG